MALRVMLVDDNAGRAAILERALTSHGYEVLRCVLAGTDLLRVVREQTPDVILIDTERPDRDVLESLHLVSRDQPRPVVMYANESDPETIREAVRAGVSAYIVNDINPDRVKPVMDVALARFHEFQALREELEKARNTLAERKVIERAKGLLMKRRGMDEEAAYHAIRKLAMDRNQRLAEVARNLLEIADLLD